MKIRIDWMINAVYEVKTDELGYQAGYFLFRFQNKKNLIERLREEKPSLKANCNCYYSTIQDRFNQI